MRVREPIESRGGALGVSTHVLKIEPITHIKSLIKANALRDAVNAITGWSPDGILNAVSIVLSCNGVIKGTIAIGKDASDGILMVEHDAGEISIEAVVEVKHVRLLSSGWILDSTTSNDMSGQGESICDIVASGFANDVDVRWNILVEGVAKHTSHLLKSLGAESTSDIKGVKHKAMVGSLLKNGMGILNRFHESERIRGSRSDMEANTNDIEGQFLGQGKEVIGGVHGCSKLQAQTTQAGRIVGRDSQKELGLREELLDLVELIGVIKCHLLDALRSRVADIRICLARLCINDAVRLNICLENLFNFGLGGTVETSPELCQKADDLGVRVTLDRYLLLA